MRALHKLMLVIALVTLLAGAAPAVLTSNPVSAQGAPEVEWDKTFGGSNWDLGASIQQTSDGGYVVTGLTWSYGAGDADVWLVKTDSSGNKQWDKTFGGSGNETGLSVQQTSDGGYVVTGSTSSYGAGDYDVWLIKTDSSGNKQWDKTFGGSSYDWGSSVQQTSDGGYVVTGHTSSYGAGNGDVWLIKTDSSGNKQWDKTFDSSGNESGYSVRQTLDGGYIVAGATDIDGAGGGDVWLIKTDSSGNKQWDKTFGGWSDDVGDSVQQTSDGGYVVAGYTWSYGAGEDDVWLIKTDSSGNEQWDNTFGGSNLDAGVSVQQTSDGGYVVAGGTQSYGAGGADVWLIKLAPPPKPTPTPAPTPGPDITPPAAVTDLAISGGTSNSVTLVWTAPGDDGNAGTATTYDIRYHTSGITEGNWNAATQCNGEPSPQSAGNGETFTVNGLNAGTHYWFALKTADEVPNWSGLSDVPSGQWMSVNQVQFSDSLNGVDVTFDSVTQAGLTKVDPSTNNPCGKVQDFRFLGKFYHITTTAIYSGNVTVTIGYNAGDLQGKEKEDEIDIFRCENGWVDVTTSRDTGKNTVTAVIPKLCFFGLAPAAPMCFIATAAYGSYLDSHVQTLRDFRDTYLVTNPVGRNLVSAYYKLSPPIAGFIDQHPSLKPIVRVGLLPAVAMSTMAVSTTLAQKIAILAGTALVCVALVVCLRRKAVKGGF